jgi:hypothetical protein
MELYSTLIQLKSGETFSPDEVTQYLDGIVINSYCIGFAPNQVIPYEDITLIKVPLKKFNETYETWSKRIEIKEEKSKAFSKTFAEHFKDKWVWCVYSHIAKRIANRIAEMHPPKYNKNSYLIRLWNPNTLWEDIGDIELISKSEFEEINSYAKKLYADIEAFKDSYII